MVAVIKTGHSVRSVLSYNENKVKEGVAQCIGEGNYPAAAADLNQAMKLGRLLHQNALNGNVKRNSVHISLNFHPSENYSTEKLLRIAGAYMEKIGFGQQPYLVYRHDDAGHPHIHLVSIKVREDGSRIDMQNIGKNQSEKARKEIEKQFGLVPAQGRGAEEIPFIKPAWAGRVLYGRSESKKAVSGVLNSVLFTYKYSSLSELNAVLGLYNIRADRGSEESRIFRTGGLVYRILDKDGKPTGVPIKASDFAMKPTLAFLERRYMLSSTEKVFEKNRIRSAVDGALLRRDVDLEKLVSVLHKEGIDVVLRKSPAGQLYGITYVDHLVKCVLNGSALGKKYSAKGMVERCGTTAKEGEVSGDGIVLHTASQEQKQTAWESTSEGSAVKVLEELFKPEWQGDYVSGRFKKRRRKSRRKGPADRN
ncbi:relaxase/mobilization nuclease domain-containing protein [Flavobacterium sp. LAR06]|uniref:relaxase/mobilization nuclease domain-containing protein n=1 Tax=Flavobacterium sp. LAR06 TaxID=3064897 RepID=UPI0035BFFDA2